MVSHFKLAFPLPKCISTQNPSNYSYPKINSQTISHGPILSEFRSKSSGRFLQLLLEFRLLFTDLSRFLQLPLWSTVLCSANLWASFSKFWALFSKFCCSCEVEWTKLCNSIFSIRNHHWLKKMPRCPHRMESHPSPVRNPWEEQTWTEHPCKTIYSRNFNKAKRIKKGTRFCEPGP